jgi:hypothetical protein
MQQKRLMIVLGVVIAISMALTACQPTATPAPATAAPAAQATSTSMPARHGGFLDEIDASVVSNDSALTQLQAGAIDSFFYGLSDVKAVKASGMNYTSYTGTYYDILYNPAVCTDTNVLNPFSDRKIREATNMLYDRNQINQEIYNGGGLVKYFPFITDGPDYTDLADVAASLEAQYAFNPDKAKAAIATEMGTLGATAGSDGKWQFNGKPVTLEFVIRNDGDGTRKPMGDYVATQLESVGFTVTRDYKKSSEASPLWIRSNPPDCKWDLYTAGWVNTSIERDGKADFQAMYLPDSAQGMKVFAANTPDPAFQTVGDNLANGLFKSLDERHQLMAQAMQLSLQDSLQVWLIDGRGFAPYSTKVQVAGDLGTSPESSSIWPFTLRFKDSVGGTLKWASTDFFTDPWNPIGGSNWAWDQGMITGTVSQGGVVHDPYTGLVWPLRFQKMDVTVKTGLPVFKTLDWVTVNSADTIAPPSDAWVDWDAKSQTFITVADAANAAAALATVNTQAATLAGAVDLKTMVAPAAAPAGKTPPPPALDAGGNALVKLATDLGTFYTTTTTKPVDVATAVKSPDTITAIEAEVAKVAGITTGAADQQKELATWAVGFVGGLDGSGYYTLATSNFTAAKTKEVVTFPPDLFKTVKWHDGSSLSVADFVMNIIETFDRAKPDSPIYDDNYVPLFQSFQQAFKGIKIDSTDPLVIEYYTDNYFQDAELMVPTLIWPNYCTHGCIYGEAPWGMIAVGNQAEADGKLAWSTDKATEKKVEWMSFVGGPSLDILTADLATLASSGTVPYAPTLSKYITADDAKTEYANIQAWYTAHKEYWIGTGPYYLDSVNETGKTLALKSFADYPDTADRWSQFSEPKLATVKLDGPASVKIGDKATFNIGVTFNGQPYAEKDIKQVKYLIFDATGAVVNTGVATAVADGQWQVVLDSTITSKLAAGSNKIEVAVAPIPVAAPSFQTLSFVTTP